MLHHLALSPLPLVDGRFPSENRGNCLAPKLPREKNYLITWLQTKDSKNGFVEGPKLNIFKEGKNKQTGKGKLKMTKVNQNPHTNKINIGYKFNIQKPAQITS